MRGARISVPMLRQKTVEELADDPAGRVRVKLELQDDVIDVLRVLVEHAVVCGLVYGELVFLFMYFVVLPLSALGPAHFNTATYITGPIGHTVLVGLPIALSVRRFAR
jgi:hypothetical protein